MPLSRRSALVLSAASARTSRFIPSGLAKDRSQTKLPITSLGLCQYCARFARTAAQGEIPKRALFEPAMFFEHARRLGAGGYQVGFGVLDEAACKQLRERAAQAGLWIEGIVRAPKSKSDLEQFDAEIATAA